MLKVMLISLLILLAIALFGYWNYRWICRNAEELMRQFSEKEA